MQNYLFLLTVVVISLGMASAFAQEYEVPTDFEPIVIPGEYIVTFYQPTSIVSGVLDGVEFSAELESLQTFTNTNQVFLVKTDEQNLSALLSDSRIQAVEPNMLWHLTGFSDGILFGLDRIDAELRPGMYDGIDDALDIDIAVFDTGINQANSDMRIASCTGFFGEPCDDFNGHGSHTSGTIGAKDNGGNGIVGVAEGARIHMMRVCPTSCPTAHLIAASDLVVARGDIEVVNQSLGGFQSTPNTGCTGSITAWQAATCRMYEAGVVVVVSAGNSQADATNNFVGCTWDATICVSAIADSDGEPGGNGGSPSCRADQDDTLADFSNFGEVIDVTAPGVCVKSYNQFGTIWNISGTSMSSPHAAGVAALTILDNGLNCTDSACVEQVRSLMISDGFAQDGPNGWTGDKDAFGEPIVNAFTGAQPPDDTTPPRSGIWSPRQFDLVKDTFTVKFWAIDPEGSDFDTCFKVDGVELECKPPGPNGVDTRFFWDTTLHSDGLHDLGGEVCDVSNNCVDVRIIEAVVDNGSLIHNIVLDSFTAVPSTVTQGGIVQLQGTVTNNGNIVEKISLSYRDTFDASSIARQFGIFVQPGETVVGDIQLWDTTGVAIDDHVLRVIAIGATDPDPDLLQIVTVEPQSIENRVTALELIAADHEVRITALESVEQGILDEDGGQGLIIIVITIFGVTITIVIAWGVRKMPKRPE